MAAARSALASLAGQLQVELLLQDLEDVRGDEAGRLRADGDALDAQREQGQQHGDGLLLEPGDDQRQRQVVDAAVEGLGQGQGHLDRAVGVVALAHVQQAGQAQVLCRSRSR